MLSDIVWEGAEARVDGNGHKWWDVVCKVIWGHEGKPHDANGKMALIPNIVTWTKTII